MATPRGRVSNTTKTTKTKAARKRFIFSQGSIRIAALAVFALVFAGFSYYYLRNQFSRADTCTVSAKLVNSCRPWLGAEANGYGVSSFKDRMAEHEKRIGRKVDIVHNYRSPGQVLSADDKYFIARPDTILLENWKPAYTWKDAAGGNASVNAQIDAMAESVKSVAPAKIMLAVFHEPENDVSPGGAPGCASAPYKGAAGTTADYVNMWHNVRARFDAKGVTNTVWVMNYMGFDHWDCMVKDLWPGNNYVDWVMWDPYSTKSSWNTVIGRFYNWMKTNSDTSHAFTSKPWGLGEWGVEGATDQQFVYQYYKDAKASLSANTFPNLKAYVIWDNKQENDIRISYSTTSAFDATEQSTYASFANDKHFTNSVTSPADTTPPSVTITAPANSAKVLGTTTINVAASDNVGVRAVDLLIDGKWQQTDDASPFSFAYDMSKLSVGNHTVTVRAWDAANNTKDASITVNVVDGTPPSIVLSSPMDGSTVSGTVGIKAIANDNVGVISVSLIVDGKWRASDTTAPIAFSLDTTKLSNGTHTVMLRAWDKAGNKTDTKPITLTVKNR